MRIGEIWECYRNIPPDEECEETEPYSPVRIVGFVPARELDGEKYKEQVEFVPINDKDWEDSGNCCSWPRDEFLHCYRKVYDENG